MKTLSSSTESFLSALLPARAAAGGPTLRCSVFGVRLSELRPESLKLSVDYCFISGIRQKTDNRQATTDGRKGGSGKDTKEALPTTDNRLEQYRFSRSFMAVAFLFLDAPRTGWLTVKKTKCILN